MHQHVGFQISSFDGREAALVATVGLLSTMLKHVLFEVLRHRKGEIAPNTRVRFVFSLHFHGGVFFVHCVLLDQYGSKVVG